MSKSIKFANMMENSDCKYSFRAEYYGHRWVESSDPNNERGGDWETVAQTVILSASNFDFAKMRGQEALLF